MSFIDKLFTEDFDGAKEAFIQRLSEVLRIKLENLKAQMAFREFPGLIEYVAPVTSRRNIQNVRRVGRLKYVKVRVRRGKIQRRKKVSAVKGWTFRQGRLIRMRPVERLHRRLAARRAKIKRRSKMVRIRRRTAFAMRKRKSLGLSYKPFGRY